MKKIFWTVCSAYNGITNTVTTLSVFKSLDDALEYAAFVTHYDMVDDYKGWCTYVVEGDFIYQ